MTFSKILPVLGLTFLGASLSLAQNFETDVPVQSQPNPARNVRVEQKLGSQLPMDDTFADQSGMNVKFGSLVETRPSVILPIFYRCHGVCSLETQSLIDSLAKMQLQIGRDFDVIFLSIDPQEGPALAEDKYKSVLSSSPTFEGTGSGWHFLTGSIENIRRLTDALGFYFNYDASSDVINHPSGLMFLSPEGRVSSYILSYNYSPDLLTKNIRVAGENKVGPKTDDFFFGCVHCDPLTGKRSLVIQRVLSLAGLFTVFALAATIAGLSWKSKKKAKGTVS